MSAKNTTATTAENNENENKNEDNKSHHLAPASITDPAHRILTVVRDKGPIYRGDIAKELETTIPSVNGSVTSLLRHGLVEVSDKDGSLSVTNDGKVYLNTPRPERSEKKGESKMDKAARIFEETFEKGRQAVLARLRKEAGLSEAGASTYYQQLRARNGMGVAQAKKTPPKLEEKKG